MKRQWTEEELERRIADRLGERQRKLNRMEELERPRRNVRLWKPAATVLALAACLAVAVYVSPLSGGSDIGADYDEAARGTGINVQPLLREGRYDEALGKVDSALRVADRNISELNGEILDDEVEYALQSEETKKERLQALREKIMQKMNR